MNFGKKLRDNENLVLILIIVGVLLLMWALNPARFFQRGNLQSMAFQLPELGLLSLGMMIIMVTGGINLAVVSTANLAGIVAALIMQANPSGGGILLAIVGALVVAAIVGAANGVLVAWIGVSPILATLGMMTLLNGISIVLTKGYVISGFPAVFQWIGNGVFLGVPAPMLLFILVAIGLGVIMNRSAFGFEIYMLGTNETATRFSGINVNLVLLKSYVLSGILSGLAALVMISRFNSAKSDYGQSYLLVTVLAAVLGGTSVYGGFGKASGLVLSLVILQIVSSGLNLLQVNAFMTRAIWGMILAGVMIVGFYRNKRQLARR